MKGIREEVVMKEYKKPEMEIIEVDFKDIITTSNEEQIDTYHGGVHEYVDTEIDWF
jgi:hypothetical protein